MSDRYHFYDMKCAWCEKKQDEVIYADEWGEEFTCEFCRKRNKVIMSFETRKLDK